MQLYKAKAASAALFVTVSASARSIGTTRLGIIGGYTSSDSNANIFRSESRSFYHAGLAFQLPLVSGFAIQPAVTYQVKGAYLNDAGNVSDVLSNLKTKVGYLEIPIQIQWGPDLLLFRPYLFAEPFIGFAMNTKNKSGSLKEKDFDDAAIKRSEYGLGLGGGIELLRFQLSVRYFWNFGSLYEKSDNPNSVGDTIRTAFKGGKNFKGVTFSAVIFF